MEFKNNLLQTVLKLARCLAFTTYVVKFLRRLIVSSILHANSPEGEKCMQYQVQNVELDPQYAPAKTGLWTVTIAGIYTFKRYKKHLIFCRIIQIFFWRISLFCFLLSLRVIALISSLMHTFSFLIPNPDFCPLLPQKLF